MKKVIIALLLSIVNCQLSIAQIGTWRNYLAYYDVQQIQAAGDELFVLASNGLYKYNKKDQSITTYDKVNGLSDTYISHIRWCQQAKRLIAVYSNTNIDLIDTKGNVTNISDIYTKVITGDKTINNVYIYNQYAYLACGFGIVKVNVKDAEISESYMLGFPVTAITISDNNIYAQASNAVYCASLNTNLIDKSNWSQTTIFPSFDEDSSDYDDNIELVKTLKPGGPKYNYFGFTTYKNNQLYTTTYTKSLSSKGGIQILDNNNNWTIYQDSLEKVTGHAYVRTYSVDTDPLDISHAMVAARTGVYEFRNGKFVKEYNYDNSDGAIQVAITVSDRTNKDYVMTTNGIYDKQGNFWCLNSVSPSAALLKYTNDGKWLTYPHQELQIFHDNAYRSFEEMRGMMFDSRGLMWFVNDFYRMPALVRYNTETDEVKVYSTVTNQDGISYGITYAHCVAEDLEGNIWIGTNLGAFYLPVDATTGEDNTLYQFKVPRNDGTNYADYLLNGIDISCIAVDGAGRKWFGTYNNGVYLISADNMTQIHHFTTTDSHLLSDNIESIAINNNSGEVFIGTDKGLCSYMSDATASATEMTEDNVYAYPNPVTPDYTGLITITGLTLDADVKILNSNGKLIKQGRSNGGTFTWDGFDSEGNRVASGVYMVATATSKGEKGTVCKIAIVR